MQARGARGAVIIDIVDRDRGHSELVEDALAAGAVAVTVAGYAGIDIVVVDMGVEKRFNARFEAELCVFDFAAGFDKLGHPDAEDVGG